MRIACANWTRRRAGGIESYLEFVVSSLQALGHEVSFWSERDTPADRPPLRLPAHVATWCADTGGRDRSLAQLREWKPSVLFVHGFEQPEIERRLLDVAPAVALAHSYYGTCISGSKTTRFPSTRPCGRVFGPACLGHFYPRRCGGLSPLTLLRDYARQATRLALLHRYEAVLTLSSHMRAEYVRHGLGEQRVRNLPAYIPSHHPAESPASAGGRSAGRGTTLCFLGRIDRLKGLDVAIEALPRVRATTGAPVHLIVAGDGPDRARCQRLADAVRRTGSLEVTFHGWIDGSERQRLFATSDVLVFPSLWPEPYGLAGVEGVIAGLPVAAFRSGAVGEWLRDGLDGALAAADPPSAAGLADAIVRCLRTGRREPWSDAAIAEHQRRHIAAVASHLAGAVAIRSGLVVA
jgi:glycosyltransferase involved in cell wall biosynthesis